MMLLLRELKIMLRSPAGAIQSLMFSVLVIALFPLAITPDPDQLEPLGIGLIWVVTLLSCLLAADKSLAGDYADGSLEQMVLSDYPLWWVCLVKSMAHWVSCALPLLLMAPILGAMLAMPLDRIVWLMASLVLGSPILSLVLYVGRHANGWVESKQCVAAHLDRPIPGANLDSGYSVGDDRGRGLLWLHVGGLAVPITCDPALCNGGGRKNSG